MASVPETCGFRRTPLKPAARLLTRCDESEPGALQRLDQAGLILSAKLKYCHGTQIDKLSLIRRNRLYGSDLSVQVELRAPPISETLTVEDRVHFIGDFLHHRWHDVAVCVGCQCDRAVTEQLHDCPELDTLG